MSPQPRSYLSLLALPAQHCQALSVLEVGKLLRVKPGGERLDEGNDGRVSAGQPLLPLLLPLLSHDGGPEHYQLNILRRHCQLYDSVTSVLPILRILKTKIGPDLEIGG